MILFEQDFYRENASVHTDTKNFSFIKTSLILKRLGISNNKFPLAILDKDLCKYDPHNLTDPSLELRFRIAQECKLNPWYYFREVVRVPAQGSDPIPFILNRANCALIWIYYNHFDLIQVIPRQTGKTISTQAIFSHIIYIAGKNLTVSMLTKDNTLRQENVIRLKDIRDSLPSYLIHSQASDSDNKEGISYTRLKNRYLTFVAQKDDSSADNLGRGMTTPTQHWDEAGMFSKIEISYPVAVNATNKAVETAKANGQPHSNILTTTAGKLDTAEGRFTHSLITNAMTFTEKIYDVKDINELTALLKSGSTNMMFYLVYSYLQLGYTHEWFKEKSARSNATKDDIDRDYLNIWKFGGAAGVIPQTLLKALKEYQRDPLFTELEGGYVFRWYVERHFVESGAYDNVPMILGMDSSENVGRDFTALVLIDARNMAVVGTCRCNESNIMRMAMFIAKFLVRFKKTLFIPEHKSTGGPIIDAVILELERNGINPFSRIFNKIVQERKDDPKLAKIQIDGSVQADGTVRKYFGFHTSSANASRTFLYKTVLMKTLELNAQKIYDSILIEEMSALTVKNGRVDHVNSGHDDTVIAYLLACYVLFAGKNLSFYGIEGKVLLSQMSESEARADESYKDIQNALRVKAAQLEEKINSSTSDLIRASLIKQLNDIKSRIDDKVIDLNPISIEKNTLEESAIKEATRPVYTPEQFNQFFSVI